jgi:hypothetical protein
MGFANTYLHSVLIGLDDFGAALLFNRNDVTISAMCRVVQLVDRKDPAAEAVLQRLALYPAQVFFLRWVGRGLTLIKRHHCAKALVADMQRASAIQALLDGLEVTAHVN